MPTQTNNEKIFIFHNKYLYLTISFIVNVLNSVVINKYIDWTFYSRNLKSKT